MPFHILCDCNDFYFVSEAPNFKNLFFFFDLLKSSVSMFFTIFFHRIDGLLLKHDMIIFLSSFRIFFRIFPDFPQCFERFLTIFLLRIDGLILKYDIITLFYVTLSNFCIFFCIFLQILISLFEINVCSTHEVGLRYLSLVKRYTLNRVTR